MSELRDFVADLLEWKGAAVEAREPEGLEVLAPAPLQEAMGWPELAQREFHTLSNAFGERTVPGQPSGAVFWAACIAGV